MNRFNIIDEPLLAEFRRKHVCETCGRGRPLQVHHVFAKGRGNANRFDIRINLIAVCAECHDQIHRANILTTTVVNIVAEREGVMALWIREEMSRLRWRNHAETRADNGQGEARRQLADDYDREEKRQRSQQDIHAGKVGPTPRDRDASDPINSGKWREL